MSGLVIGSFSGFSKKVGARLLQGGQSQIAANCRLASGYLRPMSEKLFQTTPGKAGIQSIFKLTDACWLSWSFDVDVVRSLVANDLTNRFYFTGDGEPRASNLSLATAGSPYPNSFYVLGVFPPSTAPSPSHAGGVGAAISRAFVYTFVTPWGEESQPSPASAVTTGKVDGTWTVASMQTAPANSFTVTGASWSSGVATFTVSSTFGLRVGEEISLPSGGINPTGYGFSKAAITALTSTTIAVSMASNPGAWVAGGTISRVAPHNTTGMTKRIYWSETTATGTDYRFVKEVPVADVSTTVPGNTVSQESLPSSKWAMPPVDAKGIIAHPAGFYLAFRGNEVLISDAGIPYGWPVEYRKPSDYPVVGLGVWGATAVVCTTGVPYNLTGVDPASLTMTRATSPWPCLSKRGIASSDLGVAFPTHLGVVVIGASGEVKLSGEHFNKESFAEFAPSTFVAANYAGRYVASYETDSGVRNLLVIDPSDEGVCKTVSIDADEVWSDIGGTDLYVVCEDSIYLYDGDQGQRMLYEWFSREYVTDAAIGITAAKVDAKFEMSQAEIDAAAAAQAAAIAANNAILAGDLSLVALAEDELAGLELCGAAINDIPPTTFDAITFQLYANGILRFSTKVTSRRPFRIGNGTGFKSNAWSVKLLGNVEVQQVIAAETMTQINQA